MENNKSLAFIIVFIMVTCFCGCSEKETIIESELIKIDENEMLSSEVAIGELGKTVKKEAQAFYPITSQLAPAKSGVVLVDVKVNNLEYVKKGDLLVEIRPYNAEEIAKKEEDIRNKEADMNEMMVYFDNEYSQLNSLYSSSSGTDRQIYQLKIEENRLNRDYSYKTYTAEIENLKKELEVIKEDKGDCNIYSPYDGVIDSVLVSKEGTVLSDSMAIIKMHSIDTVVIYFDDPGYVYCDNDVKVIAGSLDNRQEITGKVVCDDHYLHSAIRSGKIYVRLEGEYDKENLSNIEVEINTYNIKNVLTAKSNSIVNEKDKQYVYILEDGELKKRHVIVAGDDGENAWILQGIKNGDIVYLQ